MAGPALAQADPGVLLSGYAPPGAGEEGILGTAGPATGTAGSHAAVAPHGALPLAQAVTAAPVATPSTSAGTAPAGRPSQPTHTQSHRTARHTRVQPAPLPAASPAIVAAADRSASGSPFSVGQGLLAALLAITTLGLALTWRRQDR